MPIYKQDGKNADGLTKYKVRVKQKDADGKWHSLTRITYGLSNAKSLEWELTGAPAQVSKTMTLGDLFDAYLETVQGELRSSTVETNAKIYRNYIAGVLGDVELTKLNAQTLQAWKNNINTLPLALTTKQNIYTVLNIILNFGVKYEYMQFNPLAKVGTFKNSNLIVKEMEVYTPEQWKRYRQTALDYSTKTDKLDFYVFFNIAYYTGLRKGEIHALRWSCLDGVFLSVKSSISQRNAGDIETPPKNKRSVRSIEIPVPLQNTLTEHLRRVSVDPFFTPDKFICGFDKPLRNTSLDVYNRTVAQLAGLPRLRIHDFRHTHASTLINANVPVIEISKRLGHSSIEQTLETYSHLFKSTSKLSIDVLNSIE